MQEWVDELRKFLKAVPIAIAGNKADLKARAVEQADAEAYAEMVSGKHFSTSAKTGKGVEDLFVQITKAILSDKNAKEKNVKSKQGKKAKKRDTVGQNEGYTAIMLGEPSANDYGGIRISSHGGSERKKKKSRWC